MTIKKIQPFHIDATKDFVFGNLNTDGTFQANSTVNLGSVSNVKITGGTANYVLKTDGAGNLSWAAQTGGGGTPGGANTQIQFNDAGTFGGNANLTFDKVTSVLTVTGNIAATNANLGNLTTSNYFTGNGSLLSSITGANVTGQVANALIAGTVYTAAQPNITSVGLLTALSIGPNSSITLTGTSGFVKANSIQGTDGVNAIYPAYSGATGAVGITGNLTVGIGVAANITANGNVTANYFIGNGSSLTSIAGANVTGQVANATVAGTVYTNAQPNITSLGTLTSLTSNGTINFTNASNVTLGAVGNIKITGGTTGYVLSTDGAGNLSWVAQSGGSGSPGGANTQIQFNDGGSFAGNAELTFDKTTTTLTANNFIATSTANLGNVGNVKITGGTNGYVLSTDGAGNLSWVAGGGGGGNGATITDNTTTNATYYPVYATATSGGFSTAGISTTKLQFNPSSGQLTVQDLNMLSDATLKENPEVIADPFEILSKLFGMGFTWADTGKKSYGLLAQMLEQVLPELVSENAQGKKTVNYIPIIAFLIEAVKKLQSDIETLKER